MNFCAHHNQFYKDFCVYCGRPGTQPVIPQGIPSHFCRSTQSSGRCDICGKPMISSSWPDVTVVTQECGGKSDAG